MAVRVQLLKSYHHDNKKKAWSVGTVLQLTQQLASDLIHEGIAIEYKGEYPPKKKMKLELKQLK